MTKFRSLYLSFAHNCLLHFRLTTLIMWNHLINFFNFIKKTLGHKSMSNFAKPRVIKLSLRKRESKYFSVKILSWNHTLLIFLNKQHVWGKSKASKVKSIPIFLKTTFNFDDDDDEFFPFLRYTIFSRIIFPLK